MFGKCAFCGKQLFFFPLSRSWWQARRGLEMVCVSNCRPTQRAADAIEPRR